MRVPIEESLSTADGLHYGCERWQSKSVSADVAGLVWRVEMAAIWDSGDRDNSKQSSWISRCRKWQTGKSNMVY